MPQPPNLNKMLAEAQAMLAQQQEAQEKLKSGCVEATAGGGMVTVVVNGHKQLQSIKIDPEVVSKDDVELLQDMILAATNEALRKSRELVQQELGKLTGGLKIPGLGL